VYEWRRDPAPDGRAAHPTGGWDCCDDIKELEGSSSRSTSARSQYLHKFGSPDELTAPAIETLCLVGAGRLFLVPCIDRLTDNSRERKIYKELLQRERERGRGRESNASD
jgi:hypothetical protein